MTRARIDHPDLAFAAAPDRACADRPDVNWFPERLSKGVPEAVHVCRTCPHVNPCLEWGLAFERFGIWGATTQRERMRIRRDRGMTVTPSGPPRSTRPDHDNEDAA